MTDNLWHPIQLPGVQAVRCTRFVDRENLSGFRARLRFNDRAASELIEPGCSLMAQAKNCMMSWRLITGPPWILTR